MSQKPAMDEKDRQMLALLLSKSPIAIVYRPLRTEVSLAGLDLLPEGSRKYEIAPHAELDPIQEALKAKEIAGSDGAVILIPGRAFDTLGTRHGRGGGWYDRFLAHVPIEWERIGFCFDDQFSEDPLPRQPWDEVMDFVAVANRKGDDLILHTTHARS